MGSAVLAGLGRLVGFLMVAVAWCAFCWFTGRPFRHQPRRRYVTRPVRATGQCLLAVVVAGLWWRPLATGVVLAAAGGALVVTAAVTRRRAGLRAADPAGGPVRVQAVVGTPRPLSPSADGRGWA